MPKLFSKCIHAASNPKILFCVHDKGVAKEADVN